MRQAEADRSSPQEQATVEETCEDSAVRSRVEACNEHAADVE
jgi:hypothetical protein